MAIDPVRLENAAKEWDQEIKIITTKIAEAGGPERPSSPTSVSRWLTNTWPPK